MLPSMIEPLRNRLPTLAVLAVLLAPAAWADGPAETGDPGESVANPIPDIRDDELKLKLQKRNWVIVPIPVSNPTLDTGLVVGGAYFYPQTEAQKMVQPASVTGAGGFYSSNKSSAFAIAHQSYFSEDKWRIGGIVGHADVKLDLSTPGTGGGPSVDWLVKGELFAAGVSRKIAGKWYAGVVARYADMQQTFGIATPSDEFNIDLETVAVGLGINAEYDNRDKPFNSYTGRKFKFSAVTNSEGLGSDDTYQSYSASYASYHLIRPSLVLAWELQGCSKSDEAPLWDACRLDLRGFSATDYLGRLSVSGQVEVRWKFHRKWGAVAFAGSGYYRDAFSEVREREAIPSYGIGLRFMVLESQRINMRLDYGRSTDSDAVYLSVGEAF
ncbi:MAG: outer membrane protein assembly factor [Gammaproteobacteria bacterium]|nr:outer membrane protein assembly factor [Gammaproteobacteria bacterium]